jgi:hypothetical protein
MPLDRRVQEALSSPDPFNRLRTLVQTLQAQGYDQTAIVDLFEHARQELEDAGRESEQDAILEIMDFLVGWCSPHMSLEPPSSRSPEDAPPIHQ